MKKLLVVILVLLNGHLYDGGSTGSHNRFPGEHKGRRRAGLVNQPGGQRGQRPPKTVHSGPSVG